jgi:hypothetical protein
MENYREQIMSMNADSRVLDVLTAAVFGAVIVLGLVYMVRMYLLWK